MQAFQFALECTPEQAACVRRQFGGRRYARNWALRTLKSDIDAYHTAGVEADKPSLFGMRARWNQVKRTECVDASTGEVWWPEISKEAFADGIRAAVDGYWNWQQSRSGKRAGKRVGFPRFAKKGRDRDRVAFTTGAIRVEPDRRHVTLPRIGCVRVHENTRRLQRLLAAGRARILAVSVSRKGTRLIAAFRVLVKRPQQSRVAKPDSRIGVDVGVRVLATVANREGEVIERVANPRPLEAALKELRHLSRRKSRRSKGSRRYVETTQRISRLQRRVADIRGHHIHVLTTRLAKTHGEIVVEGLDAAGMLRQKGLTGARARRRGLSDSALGETTPPAGLQNRLVRIASRPLPTATTHHRKPAMHAVISMTSDGPNTGLQPRRRRMRDHPPTRRQRRDQPRTLRGHRIASDSAVGPVGVAVKRGADRKTGLGRAGGREARKGRSHQAAEQPRDGVPA